MKKKCFFEGFLFLLLLFGCNNTSTTTDTNGRNVVYRIDIKDCLNNVSAAKLSDIADSIRYLELKTPHSLPIGVVTDINISDEYIYICSKGIAYQFNHQGEYLRQIGGRGQGPGEYSSAGNIFINENERTANILSGEMLYTYSCDGTFIGRRTVGRFKDMVVNDSLIYASNVPFGIEKYRMVVLNQGLDTLAGIPNYNVFDTDGNTMMLTLRFRQPFYRHGEDIYFKGYQDNDTIWRMNGTGYETHAVIDMGKYKYPEYRSVEEVDVFYTDFVRKRGDYYLVLTAMEDSRFIYLSLEPYWNPEMGSPRLLFDKFQSMGYAAKTESGDYGITDDIHGGPAFWPQIISGKYYVSVINAYEFIEKSQSLPDPSNQLKEFMKEINEDSNPIVTIVTLKNKNRKMK